MMQMAPMYNTATHIINHARIYIAHDREATGDKNRRSSDYSNLKGE